MNKKYNNNKIHLIFFIFIIFSTFFLSIGYASLNSIILDINGEVTAVPQTEIYITDVTYKNSTDADIENSKIQQYYQTLMQSSVVLGNTPTSSITYSVTVYNSSDIAYFFKEVEYSNEFYDNSNIIFELDGLQKWDSIESKQSLTFSITFKYADNNIPDTKILNSYLNFKFIQGSLNDTKIIIDNNQNSLIYNLATENVKFNVVNNNDFVANINIKMGDITLQTTSLEPAQTLSVDTNIKSYLDSLQPNQDYHIIIEQTAPYAVTKQTACTVQVIPTITNYDLGLRTTGNEQNPYILYKIEDLVRLAQNVKNANTFNGIYIKLISNLDFSETTNYYNYQDTSFGNLNDVEDSNEILTEMTTGSGFIVIGSEGKEFQGTFDGDNHTIANLYIDRRQKTVTIPCGLFSVLNNATIKNISIFGEYFFKRDGGGIAGEVLGTTTILNCHSNVSINNIAKDCSIGGILGTIQANSNVTVTNCSNSGNIINNSGAAAGLVGFVITSPVTITNCCNTGNISVLGAFGGDQFASGLIVKDNSGGAKIVIRNSYNTGNISCTRNRKR